MMEVILLVFKNMKKIIYLIFILACCISACQDEQKNTADIICGDSYRYWYSSYDSCMYHYFDKNGRKEQFYVDKFGKFEKFKMPDVIISTTWESLNDSTILLSRTKFPIKIIDDETIVLKDDTLHLLKDYKNIPKEYQKILGKDSM